MATALLVAAAMAIGQITGSCQITTVGCFADSTSARVFPTGGAQNGLSPYPFTLDMCGSTCLKLGYSHAGVENGNQCFCSNAAPTGAQQPMSECQTQTCPQNSSQPCGGRDRLLVFTAKCDIPPSFQGCLMSNASSYKFCNTSLSIDERLDDFVGRLTVDQKISLVTPDGALGSTCSTHTAPIEEIGLTEYVWLVEANSGLSGICIAPEVCVTTWAAPANLAASFNRTSWRLKGEIEGTEMRAFHNANWHRQAPQSIFGLTGFGPNLNIVRDPRWGRNSEIPSEDPHLAGSYGYHMVSGMMKKDEKGHPLMLAYLKHFTAYSVEKNRGHDTYNISMRDMFETFLAQFERAFKANPVGVMCSYPAENGHPSCANGWLLNTVMREQWNQPYAHVTSDCKALTNLVGPPANATDDAEAAVWAINNGTDLEMGSTIYSASLAGAIANSSVSEETLDNAVKRGHRPHFMSGRFDPVTDYGWTAIGTDQLNTTFAQRTSFEAVLQSFVLLKNDATKTLPLKKGSKIAVLGPMGQQRFGLMSDYAPRETCFPRDGTNYAYCIPTIAEEIAAANEGGVTVTSAGCDLKSSDTSGFPQALSQAGASDVVVLVMGINQSIEHEDTDRSNTTLPGVQPELVLKVLALGKPTVMIMVNGGVLAIDNLIAGTNAIIEAFKPATQGPRALAETLFGMHNRWGKLPVTIYPESFITENPMTNFDMALPPGRTYKYYTGEALFEFGFGLSYTNFSLTCSRVSAGEYGCTVKNVGETVGDEIVQVYHSAGADVRAKLNYTVPMKSLVDFERLGPIEPGQSMVANFSIPDDSLTIIDMDGKPQLFPGTHNLTFTRGHGAVTNLVVTLN